MKTLIVSLFAGPGAGKSTLASGLFYKLKMNGINCELITEYAKDKTWEENKIALDNQLYIAAKQIYRQERVEGKVDIIITDSPILLSLLYWKDKNANKGVAFSNLMWTIFGEKDNLSIFVKRQKEYKKIGRTQTEKEAKKLDNDILTFLHAAGINYHEVAGTPKGLEKLYEIVMQEYRDRL